MDNDVNPNQAPHIACIWYKVNSSRYTAYSIISVDNIIAPDKKGYQIKGSIFLKNIYFFYPRKV